MLLLLLLLVVIPFTILLLFYFKHFFVSYKTLTKLPGPPSANFVVGNVSSLYTTPDKIFKILRQWAKEYGPIYQTTVLGICGANIVDPDDCELVMNNIKHIKKSFIYNIVKGWLRLGLLTSTGNRWQTRRKILTPAFHFSILQEFMLVFNEETEQLVENLKKQCDKPFIPINNEITQYTLKSIAETAMGTKLTFNTKEEQEYKNSIIKLGEIFVYRLIRTWLAFTPIYIFSTLYYYEKKILKTLHLFTNKIILKREKNFKNDFKLSSDNTVSFKKKRRLAMLDLLLDAKSRDEIDHIGIQEEVDTFMFEGHDTTAVALGFALMTLACHKNAQEQILEEMDEVLGGNIHKKPTISEVQDMRYLDRCLKEILRLYPSVPFISRELGEDLITKSGYFLSSGSCCHIHIYDIHHNPEIYPDPEKFDPDRFLPENVKDRHLYAYVPFSAGPRNCIGQRFALLELKSAICGILANFILEPVDTPETISFVVDIVLRTKDDIKVKFIPRIKS